MFDVKTGQPVAEGRYIGFKRIKPTPEWCEPYLVTWAGGKWHGDAPLGWIGPLPVVRVVDLLEGWDL